MKQNWQQAGQKVKPGLKIAGKLVLMTALRYGPAGVAGWAIKSVARKPVRMLLAVALEPLLQKPFLAQRRGMTFPSAFLLLFCFLCGSSQ